MVSIWEYNQLRAEYADAGSWTDPDLIQAGFGGVTATEYRAQFSLWAIGAAPLIPQADPAKAPAAIVANPAVIAVGQDRLGAHGRLVRSDGWYHVLVKPLANGNRAVVLFNESDRAATISTDLGAGRHLVEDLWTGAVTGTNGALAAQVPAHDAAMYRVLDDQTQVPLVTFEVDPSPLGDDRPTVLEPGKSGEIITRVTNTGATRPLRDLTVRLAVPQGWQVTARTPATTGRLNGGETFTVTWAVTPPATAAHTDHPLSATATFEGRPGARGRGRQGRRGARLRHHLPQRPDLDRRPEPLRPRREGHLQR